MSARLHEYQVVGRGLPTETDPAPKLYRMRLYAPNEIVAKSRFWYFMKRQKRVKKANGETISINEIHQKKTSSVLNFGIWLRYDSRSGTHNMYKEFRALSRCEAVDRCYQEMASRHRARFQSIQVIRIAEVKAADLRRPHMNQLVAPGLKFPLPHATVRSAGRRYRSLFLSSRPTTTL